MPLKIDFHVHTRASRDALGNLEEIARYARARGIDAVVITDHDRVTVEDVVKVGGVYVIPGVEVSTEYGHILGISYTGGALRSFLASPKGSAKGLMRVLAHPFHIFGKARTFPEFVDAVEVYNSSALPFERSSKLAFREAAKRGLALTAGSDAHHPKLVGTAYVGVETEDVYEVLNRVVEKKCGVYGKGWSPVDHAFARVVKLWRILRCF